MSRWLATLCAITVGACSSPMNDPDPEVDASPLEPPPVMLPPLPGEIQASDVERDLDPALPPGALETLVAGNTAFAVEMYRSVGANANGNLFMSPLSVSLALAMTYAGARGETATQMAQAMHYDLPGDDLHAAFNALDLALDSRGLPMDGSMDRLFQLNLANATFGQVGYPFLQDYIDLLARHYESGMSLLDFAADPDAAVDIINAWIAEATGNRLPDVLKYGDITERARLVLTNAIYFKATWQSQFDEDATEPGTFRGLAGDITAQMMSDGGYQGHYQGDGYRCFSLNYQGGELDMVLIVPDEGMFSTIESSIDGPFLADVFAGLTLPGGRLIMPKFNFRQNTELQDILVNLGMVDAFSENLADFSGIDGSRELSFAKVIHDAFVAVDENGTEAAAVTVVLPPPPSVPPPPDVVDRPFIFLIRDKPTGAILFMGRVLDPTAD